MEELLNEMRQDINKLPAQLANQSSVTQKLQLSDNNILTRLTTGIPSIQAGKQNAPTIQVLSRTRDRTEVLSRTRDRTEVLCPLGPFKRMG